MTIYQIRRANLVALIESVFHNRKKVFADAIGSQPSQVSQWISGNRNISEHSARRIEACANRPAGWLDTPPHRNLEAQESGRIIPIARPSLRIALEVLCVALSVIQEPERREGVGALLKACAVGAGDSTYIDAILAAMRKSQPPRSAAHEAS